LPINFGNNSQQIGGRSQEASVKFQVPVAKSLPSREVDPDNADYAIKPVAMSCKNSRSMVRELRETA
jgi:hypothetical protein